MFDEGSLQDVIDKTYPVDQIVEAHRYVDGGHKKGNVVVVL
jgi:NADPH:quinone reductase-like Zn-dependent oxidoreductase